MYKLTIALGMFVWATSVMAEAVTGTMYKNPNCGCCLGHLDHVESGNYKIDYIEKDDMEAWKTQHGLKEDVRGCHTIVMEGYTLEGHLPVSAINQFLEEQPSDIKGLTVPGMPMFSPGMMGQRGRKLTVYEINKDGSLGAVYGKF